ncbi:MAG: hypothetical protein ACK56G_15750, partial [Pirellulaceae bacterium]
NASENQSAGTKESINRSIADSMPARDAGASEMEGGGWCGGFRARLESNMFQIATVITGCF